MNVEYPSPVEFDESIRKKEVNFIIDGQPRGKERPRMRRFGRFVSTYTPTQTKNYENIIKKSYRSQENNFKLDNNVEAVITAYFAVPKSASKKQTDKLLEEKYYTKKPDCDNIAKVVLDALNGIAYNDDSQICKLSVEKFYGDKPCVEVTLREIKGGTK